MSSNSREVKANFEPSHLSVAIIANRARKASWGWSPRALVLEFLALISGSGWRDPSPVHAAATATAAVAISNNHTLKRSVSVEVRRNASRTRRRVVNEELSPGE